MSHSAPGSFAPGQPSRSDPPGVSRVLSTHADSSLVALRSAGSKKPLFFIHGVDGDVRRFAALTNHLPLDRPIYGIRAQAFVRGARALTRIEDQAAFYVREIRRIQPEGPYHLVGFSFGGLVALEIAQQLLAQGRPCGLLGAVDNLHMRSSRSERPGASAESNRVPVGARLNGTLTGHLSKMFQPGGISYAWEKLAGRSLRITYTVLERIGQPIPAVIKRPYDVNWFAAVRYEPRKYPGRVTLFQSATSNGSAKATEEMWKVLAEGGIEVRKLSGTHETLFEEPNVSQLAREIEASVSSLA